MFCHLGVVEQEQKWHDFMIFVPVLNDSTVPRGVQVMSLVSQPFESGVVEGLERVDISCECEKPFFTQASRNGFGDQKAQEVGQHNRVNLNVWLESDKKSFLCVSIQAIYFWAFLDRDDRYILVPTNQECAKINKS